MNAKVMRITGHMALLAVLCLLFAACGTTRPKPRTWNVEISKITTTSIEVDLVGVSPTDKPYWNNGVKPDDYWKPNSSIRKNAHKISNDFRSGSQWVLSMDDPIWTTWLGYGATELMIMANLPGRQFDNGPFDRRRVFLTMDKRAYKLKDKTIRVEIMDDFIRVLTPPMPVD